MLQYYREYKNAFIEIHTEEYKRKIHLKNFQTHCQDYLENSKKAFIEEEICRICKNN